MKFWQFTFIFNFWCYLLSVLIVGAGIIIVTSHPKEDDLAGFLALCMAATLVSVIIVIIAAKFEKKVNLKIHKC